MIGDRVYALRVLNKLTQSQLGAVAGLGQSTVSNIEKGKAHLRLDHAARFAEKLRCKVEDLLDNGPEGPTYTIVFNPPPKLVPG